MPSTRAYELTTFDEIRNTEYDQTFLDGVRFGVSPSGLGYLVYNPNSMNPAENYPQNWKKTLYMMLNGQHIHTVASSVNIVSNTLLKYVMAAGGILEVVLW